MIVSSKEPNDQVSIQIFLYIIHKSLFLEQTDCILPKFNGTITNLIALDFNNDNVIDLLVSVYNYLTDEVIHFILLKDKYKCIFNKNEKLVITKKKEESSIFIGDFNGDKIPEIMINENNIRTILSIKTDNSDFEKSKFESLIINNSSIFQNPNSILAYNYSSGFLDLDGDCLNDLFLVTNNSNNISVEIWQGVLYNGSLNYKFLQNFYIDNNIGQFSFGDFDRDGLIDIIFPIYSNNSFSIGVSLNLNMNGITVDLLNDDYCKKVQIKSKENQNISKIIYNFTNSMNFTSQDLDLSDYKLFSENNTYINPIIRVGDLNIDSYPDLLFTVESNKDLTRKTVFLLTSLVNKQIKFTYNSTNDIVFSKNDSMSCSSSFFDLNEDGSLDIIVVTKDKNSNYNTIAFVNNVPTDSIFLKSILINRKDKFFSNIIGTSYRFIATNLEENIRMDTSVQSPQNSNMQLNLPFSFIGIGPSNNLVMNFLIISPIHQIHNNTQDQYFYLYTPIIPNSQLFASYNDGDWQLESLLNPQSFLILLIVIISSILLIILGFIIILHKLEKVRYVLILGN